MKKIILALLIIIPSIGYSQRDQYAKAFLNSIPTDLGEAINMPDQEGGADFRVESIAPYSAKQRVLVIVSDSLYRKIFSRYNFTQDSLNVFKGDKSDWYYKWMVKHMVDSIPKIDFTKKELVLYSACAQCLTNCHHDTDDNSCHRNVCDFTNRWFLRNKGSQ